MDFPQTRVGFGNPPMPECDSLEFTTVVGQTTVLCGFELTGKMERLIDKFYFDTCSLGEPIGMNQDLLHQINLIVDNSFVAELSRPEFS